MTDTITVVEQATEIVTVVEQGPQGPAGTGGEEIAADLAQEITDRAAADESLQSQLDDFDIDPATVAAAIAADPDLAGQIVSAVSDVATDSEVASAIAAAIAAHAAGDASDAELAAAVATLNTALGGKAALSHTHAQSDVTGLTAALAAKVATRTYRATVLADSPALYWPLDDTYGANDQSGNSRNGSASGGISIGGFSDSPLPGGSKCTDFDGTDDKITSSYTGCFTNGSPVTFEGWAKRDTRSSYSQLFGDGGNNSAGLRVDQTSQQVAMQAVTGAPTWAAVWPRNGEWVHWALVADEANDVAELYINGQSRGAVYTSWSWGSYTGFLLGSRQDAALWWDGKQAEVAIYPSLLSARRIMAHYLVGCGAFS